VAEDIDIADGNAPTESSKTSQGPLKTKNDKGAKTKKKMRGG